MSIIIPQQATSDLIEEQPQISDKILFPKKVSKPSKSPIPRNIKKNKLSVDISHNNPLQTSMLSLNKSNISIQKIKLNKKQYEQYMHQKRYLISKTQYHKLISNLVEIDKKINQNNEIIESYNLNLAKLKETKKKKKEEIMELLSNKESLEEIYLNKISSLNTIENNNDKEKKDNINGQNDNKANLNEIENEHTNPNTNDSNNTNNSNEENKGKENDKANETHKKKESSSLSGSSEINEQIDIKVDDIKSSDQQKYEEQVISFANDVLRKKDYEFNIKLKEKVKLTYQSFFTEINSPENDNKNTLSNFFLRISLFISNYSQGIMSEKNVNLSLHELMKINKIGVEISEILKFLNKNYKESKAKINESIRNLEKKNENLNMKKISFESKKEELKLFMEEYKEKYNNSKNKNETEDDNIFYASFISDNDNNNNNNNNNQNKKIFGLKSCGSASRLKISKINFDHMDNSKNKNINNNNDLNNSRDITDNSDRQIIDNINKYLINSLQINESNNKKGILEDRTKKIFLHKNYFNNNGINVNNLLINNNISIANNNIIESNNENKINLANNDEIIENVQNSNNSKKANYRIVYRSSRFKNEVNNANSVAFHNNNSNLQDLLSSQKKTNSNNLIFLKDNKSKSFKNINDINSPSKVTTTHRRNHIYFQREDVKKELFSRSPDNNLYNNKTDIAKNSRITNHQSKIIPLNKGNFKLSNLCENNKKTNLIPYSTDKLKNKKIDITKIDKSNVYSKRYDNRLKTLIQGIKESYCYFKFCEENHVEYNVLDGLLKTPENLDYVEGYISIDVFLHKFKIIPKIYQNKIIGLKELMENLKKDIYLNGLNNDDEEDINNINYIGIDLKQIVDIYISKEMKDIVKIYSTYMKYGGGQDKPDMNKFLNSYEIKDIQMEKNDKMKAAFCKYFIFTLKLGKRASEKVEFIFINFDQFNLWYNCLDYIIKINNQTPKIITNKNYNIHGSPNKNK